MSAEIVHRCYFTRELRGEYSQHFYCGEQAPGLPDYSDRREATCPSCIAVMRECEIIATYGSLGT